MASVHWRLSTAQAFDKHIFTSIATHIPWRKGEAIRQLSAVSLLKALPLLGGNNTVKHTPSVPSDTLWLPAGESLLSHFQTMKRNVLLWPARQNWGHFIDNRKLSIFHSRRSEHDDVFHLTLGGNAPTIGLSYLPGSERVTLLTQETSRNTTNRSS